jgi:hypothetical protein
MMMKRLSLAILCCFLLSGCIFDPAFDMSSWESYQASLAAMKAKLGQDDLRRLDIALKYLAIENTLKMQADVQMASNVAAITNNLNPIQIFIALRPKINGVSAAAILRDLPLKLDTEIAQAEAGLQREDSIQKSVEITTPGYYWKRSGRFEQPAIEFAVFNGGTSAISRVHFRLALTTPNRTIPWAKQDYIEVFHGGLEPHERRQLSLQPQGAWTDPQLKYLTDAVLKVDVLNYEDANGQKMLAVDKGSLELKRKVRAALG